MSMTIHRTSSPPRRVISIRSACSVMNCQTFSHFAGWMSGRMPKSIWPYRSGCAGRSQSTVCVFGSKVKCTKQATSECAIRFIINVTHSRSDTVSVADTALDEAFFFCVCALRFLKRPKNEKMFMLSPPMRRVGGFGRGVNRKLASSY